MGSNIFEFGQEFVEFQKSKKPWIQTFCFLELFSKTKSSPLIVEYESMFIFVTLSL